MKTPKNAKVTANNEKSNITVDFDALFTELCECKTKNALATVYNKYGFKCVTAPTTTNNTSDLYTQFNANKCGDVSRIMFTSKSIKVYASDAVRDGIQSLDKSYVFDKVNDGAIRKSRLTVARTVDNFTKIFSWFINNGVVLPLVNE